MNLPKLTDMVSADKKVYYSFYRDGELWYKAENGFEFPVPKEDMKGALFMWCDRSVFFMRFIRKHLEFLEESMKSEGVSKD
jgi:hypothetical protein